MSPEQKAKKWGFRKEKPKPLNKTQLEKRFIERRKKYN
jgi:hypothetical protein